MPADEPDDTTGPARGGGRAPGRHRDDRPGAATRTPEVDLPPAGHWPDRPRHARGGGEPHDPVATGRRANPYAGAEPAPPRRGVDPYREAPYRDAHASPVPAGGANGSGTYDDTPGDTPGDTYSDGAYDGWYPNDPGTGFPSAGSFRRPGRRGNRPHRHAPYRSDPYGAGSRDPYSADPHSADPHRDDPHRDDPYLAAPDRTYRRSPDRYDASGYGADGNSPARNGTTHHSAGPERPDPNWADGHSSSGSAADEYGTPRHGARSGGKGGGKGGGDGAGHAGWERYGTGPDGTAHAADQTTGQPTDQDRYGVGPAAARSAASGRTGAEPAVATTGGRDLRPHSDRHRVDPVPPGLPSRRPGDPPGVPAELFVETTAETPALRLDDEPPLPAPAAAEAADDDRTGEPAPERPRSGRRRILGVPAVPLPTWASRLIHRAPDEAGPVPGHGHGHGPSRPAGRRVRILIAALLVPCALATLVGVILLWPSGGPPATAQVVSQEPVRAQVTATRATDCSPGSGDGGCVALVVHMADGPRPGRDLVQVVPVEPGSPQFAVGDQVVLGWSGADPDDAGSYQVVDFQRGAPLAWLAGLFAVAVLLLGRWRGLAALAALALSFVVLLYFVVPAILAGRDPLSVAVVGACLIMFAVLYLTHGPSARTSTAVLGTLLSLALIGALGAAFSAAAQLTGLDDQTSNLIASLGTGVDARGLLLAGVVIGALGVLDDVTVTQTSAVWELRHANPGLSARGLFAAAMRIGRDHVASAVNTLVLAYAGAALPLMLLFSLSGRGLDQVVTSQDVATEIVRTLVGSIGLVASVPITTALAAAVAVRETVKPADAVAA